MYPIIFDPATTATATQFVPLIEAAVQTLTNQGNVRVDDRLHNSLLVKEPGPEYKAPLLRVDYNQTHDITLIVQRNNETGNTIEVRFDRNGILQRWQEILQQERIFHIKEWNNKKTVRHLVNDCYQPFMNPLGDIYVGRRIINYPSGAPHFEMNYDRRGKLLGPYREWDGKYLAKQLEFIDGRRHGRCLTYHHKSSQVNTDTQYNNGKKDGTEYIYNTDGTLISARTYINGKVCAE